MKPIVAVQLIAALVLSGSLAPVVLDNACCAAPTPGSASPRQGCGHACCRPDEAGDLCCGGAGDGQAVGRGCTCIQRVPLVPIPEPAAAPALLLLGSVAGAPSPSPARSVLMCRSDRLPASSRFLATVMLLC